MSKRAASLSSGPVKKRRITRTTQKKPIPSTKIKKKNKSTAARAVPVPEVDDDNDVELSDQDYNFLEEFGDSTSFLRHLDSKSITRSKREAGKISKLTAETPIIKGVSCLESSGEASDDVDAVISTASDPHMSIPDDSDTEMPYEHVPRKSHLFELSSERRIIERLPIKLADGRLLKTGVKNLAPPDQTTNETERREGNPDEPECGVEDISTGARFGRPAVLDIMNQASRRHRIEQAKVQIATVCQEIIADPENSLGWLKRLHTFSMKEISSPSYPKPLLNDPLIRKLAILSQLAVFKDIIPGYRIRALTEKEAGEKVSQMVAHLRDWEQGLVASYQNYLRCLETELKARSDLAETALKCMCNLLTDLTHFNFRVNLMACIIGQLSRRSWTKMSEMCLNTLNSVLRADMTGEPSLEIVRILNRMIKERRFQIHPDVLTCLLNLRLKSELNVRASNSRADDSDRAASHRQNKETGARIKSKTTNQPHLSKKARKTLKERKEVEKELREAEAVVDNEEKAARQTETLKLLFALYFRILKNPTPTPLLPAALHGISKYAHLVNVDFFKDLMSVLRNLFTSGSHENDGNSNESDAAERLHLRLLGIVTAFELLSGQGEAFNIDLNDFTTQLYELILPLSLKPDIDSPWLSVPANNESVHQRPATANLLFDALAFVFSPRSFGTTAPPWRSAAFAKRLLTASLNWSPALAIRTMDFIGDLISKDPKLETLLSTEDRIYDGIYRPEINDPQLSHPFGTCFWELHSLQNHWDARVQERARKLLQTKHF